MHGCNDKAGETMRAVVSLPATTPGASRESPLARLFIEHNQELLRFLQTRLGSRQEAEEVAQESYARLLRLDQPAVLGFLRAYLFKTAANLAVDRLRHRATRRGAEPKLEVSYGLRAEPGPEELADSGQEADLAEKYLAELPAACRRAFILYRVHELSLGEVAAQTGVSERMVRYYVVQAMSHCRARLSEAHLRRSERP
jgi:RNA polymerase sigma-70 factor (ECF subfamily)